MNEITWIRLDCFIKLLAGKVFVHEKSSGKLFIKCQNASYGQQKKKPPKQPLDVCTFSSQGSSMLFSFSYNSTSFFIRLLVLNLFNIQISSNSCSIKVNQNYETTFPNAYILIRWASSMPFSFLDNCTSFYQAPGIELIQYS